VTLPELRRLLGQASPAPWEQLPSVVEEARIQSADDARVATLDGRLDLRYRANAALIVALRNHADALLAVAEACREYVSAEDEWGLRYGMGRERVPYRRALDAANRELRLKLAAWDALGKEEA